MFPHVEVLSSFEIRETHSLQDCHFTMDSPYFHMFFHGFSLLHDTMADIGRPKTGATPLPGQVILHSGALPSLLKLLSHAKKARDPMGKPMPIGSMVLLYMVTWIPSIYPQC